MPDFMGEAREGPGGSPRERGPDSLGRVYAVCKMAPTENGLPHPRRDLLLQDAVLKLVLALEGQGYLSPRETGAAHPPSRTRLALPAPSWRQTEQIDDDHQHQTRGTGLPSTPRSVRLEHTLPHAGFRHPGFTPRGSRYTDPRFVLLSQLRTMLLF